jgi:hypothetical protein
MVPDYRGRFLALSYICELPDNFFIYKNKTKTTF